MPNFSRTVTITSDIDSAFSFLSDFRKEGVNLDGGGGKGGKGLFELLYKFGINLGGGGGGGDNENSFLYEFSFNISE